MGPLNDAIRAAFPADHLVDFWTGMTPDLFLPDGKHLNDAGQQLRAQRAVAVVR